MPHSQNISRLDALEIFGCEHSPPNLACCTFCTEVIPFYLVDEAELNNFHAEILQLVAHSTTCYSGPQLALHQNGSSNMFRSRASELIHGQLMLIFHNSVKARGD